MIFYFSVCVEVARTQGKFASRDEIADELRNELERADPGSLYVGEGEYETTSFSVDDGDAPPKPRKLVTEPPAKPPTRLARLKIMERLLAAEAPYDAVAAVVLAETRAELEIERSKSKRVKGAA